MSRKVGIAAGVLLLCAGIAFIFGSYEAIRTWRGCAALKEVGPADADAVARIMALLDDYNPLIQSAAADALGRIGPAAKAARPALLRLLKDSSAQVRISSACALGNLGPAAEVVPGLVEALDDAEGEVRRYAAFALTLQGSLAEPAVTKLIDRLNDEHMGYMAATALGEIGPAAKRSIPEIIVVLRREQSLSRASFASALGKFGPDAKEAVPELLLLTQDPNELVRKTAIDALQSIDPDVMIPVAAGMGGRGR